MKKILVIALFAIFSFSTFAQTEQGKIIVDAQSDLSLSFMTNKYEYDGQSVGDDEKTTSINFAPSIGYFLVDNLAAGLSFSTDFNLSKEGTDKYSSTTISVGPFARYYFGSSSVKPFLHGEVGFASANYKYEDTSNSMNDQEGSASGLAFGFGAGAAFFVNEHVAINTLLGYSGASMKNGDDSKSVAKTGGITLGLGFSLHF